MLCVFTRKKKLLELFEIIIYLLDELCVINKTEIIMLKFCQDQSGENYFVSVD